MEIKSGFEWFSRGIRQPADRKPKMAIKAPTNMAKRPNSRPGTVPAAQSGNNPLHAICVFIIMVSHGMTGDNLFLQRFRAEMDRPCDQGRGR
jgi:hypothetical protein